MWLNIGMNSTTLYRIYNNNDDLIAYACRDAGDLSDGYKLFQTGSCSFPVRKWEPIKIGDHFTHHQMGYVRIEKINRKTMKVYRYDLGTIDTLPI